MIPKNQTDLTDQGTFFSLVVIYPDEFAAAQRDADSGVRQITFESFGADLLTNLGSFVTWVMELFAQLRVTIGV